MNTHDHPPHASHAALPKKGPWRRVGLVVLFIVMALAFAGYLSPQMRLQWANFAALCGF